MYSDNLKKYIPPNFDLAKYDTANLDILYWLHNLSRRIDLDAKPEDLQLEVSSEDVITSNIEVGVSNDVFLTQAIIKDFVLSDKAEYLSVVRDLTCYEVMSKGEELLSDQELSSLYTDLAPDQTIHTLQRSLGKLNNILVADGIHEDGSYRAWLEVDLACSETEIRESFDIWLKKARGGITKRSKQHTKRREYKLNKLNETTLRKWHDAKVLPYLDLMAWNTFKGNKVTSYILGEILFPPPNQRPDPTAIINDTVKPLAQKLISNKHIERMFIILCDQYRKKNT
jgi:hypothetical protein